MSDAITYNQFFDAARDGLRLGPDRHPKWQRVEPGTVIPAGQPYRIEYQQIHHAIEDVQMRESLTVVYQKEHSGFFVDSSWKPSLVLPTEPTWGIPMIQGCEQNVGQWMVQGNVFEDMTGTRLALSWVTDFILLTDEQIARIEAAR